MTSSIPPTSPWTPTPPTLRGAALPYSESLISSISQTEGFEKGIDTRDGKWCIVCGEASAVATEHCHIVPMSKPHVWDKLRKWGVVPSKSKNVQTEARNGVKMCANHHAMFDGLEFYIRWMSKERRFVLINHSRSPSLKVYHGRAVRLYADDSRTPFYGAFLTHEMRVRGEFPFQPQYDDRPIDLPIKWQEWIKDAPGMASGGGMDGGDDDSDGDGEGHQQDRDDNTGSDDEEGDVDMSRTIVLEPNPSQPGGWVQTSQYTDSLQSNAHEQGLHKRSRKEQGSSRGIATRTTTPAPAKATITFTNPMANQAEFEALMRAARLEPNWKATMIEGETWDGTAEENIARYRQLMSPEE